MAFNPALPQTNAPIASAELRDQFNGLKTLIDELPTSNAMHNALVSQTAGSVLSVNPFTTAISDPPTQAEMTALADKLNELIDVLNRS